MEGFVKVSRPQFNVTVFNRNVILTANEKLSDNLCIFLRHEEKTRQDYDDLIEALEVVAQGKEHYYASQTGEFTAVKFNSVTLITMECDFCLALSEAILEFAGSACSKNKELDLNALVAFGKKLESAGQGNYLTLNQNKKQGAVREIIIRKEYVR